MIDFYNESRNFFDTMVSIRRELHEHPETDRDLNLTANLVERYLQRLNIDYKRYSNCGIIAELGKDTGRTVALRADMDALEVDDLKDVPYKSKNKGVMHACGHDAHTAILLGAASVLKQFESQLSGRVRLIFQPAEETDGGARDMIKLGALNDVEAIFGLHVDETIDTGILGLKRGVVYAASNPFKIIVHGEGCHGAHPESGVDAIYIAAKTIDNLQGIISRETAAVQNAVITIGKINGGTAQNAVSSSVIMEGILRTLGKDLRLFTKERMTNIVKMTAEMYRGAAEIEFVESYPSFENDEKLYEWFKASSQNLIDIKIQDIKYPTMGVEDFAYYTEKVPGFFYKLGCRNTSKGITNPAHGSYFDIDENCLLIGCAAQSLCAFEYLASFM